MLICFSGLVLGQDWKERKTWPDDFPRPPKTEKSLFFLQRNLNVNTIMYDLNVDRAGNIDTRNPLKVYWRRYTGGRPGVVEEITWLQEQFAFGYSADDKSDSEYAIKLVAYKDRIVHLKKVNGKWSAIMEIDGQPCKLSNIYVYADESVMMPAVQYVDLFGKTVSTGEAIYERFYAE